MTFRAIERLIERPVELRVEDSVGSPIAWMAILSPIPLVTSDPVKLDCVLALVRTNPRCTTLPSTELCRPERSWLHSLKFLLG